MYFQSCDVKSLKIGYSQTLGSNLTDPKLLATANYNKIKRM